MHSRRSDSPTDHGRRRFLAGSASLAGGLLIGFNWSPVTRAGAKTAVSNPTPLNAFVHVGSDSRVTLIIHKSEMGQGVYTSLAQLIAEELECDWSRIAVESAPVDPAYNHPGAPIQLTGGSSSVSSSWEPLRRAGAAAREMLIAAAAARWAVPAAECHAERGRVLHEPSGRELGYGELVDEAARLPVPQEPTLKGPGQFKLLGRSVHRLDSAEKSDGSAVFSLDVKRPGQMVAVVAHPPVFGAQAAKVQDEAARRVPGVVEVFQIATGVAVVARDTWTALAGRDALEVEWSGGHDPTLSSDTLRQRYEALSREPGQLAHEKGDVASSLEAAANRIDALYELPYLAHAAMEPLNCVVEITDGRCEIWAGTQFQTLDRNAAAQAAGLPPEQVHVHTTLMGGGFGRRANPVSDYIVEAVEIARRARRPIQLVWSREDDIQGGWYRPLFVHRVSAALDTEGWPVAWYQVAVGQSIMSGTPFAGPPGSVDRASVEGAAELPYRIANHRLELHTPQVPVPVQWWRSVGHTHTAFVVETMIDELAARAGADPLAFRRHLLEGQPRHLAVLELVERHAGWGSPLPKGHARGLAVHASFGSVVAQVAEVSLVDGRPRIHRVVCAVHCGFAVNPGQVQAQMESAIVFGLSALLYGRISLRDGKVEQSNFHDYRVLRIDEAPVVEVHIVASNDPPTGTGEPGTPPIAPAVVNAMAVLTGQRIRRLPLAGQRFDS